MTGISRASKIGASPTPDLSRIPGVDKAPADKTVSFLARMYFCPEALEFLDMSDIRRGRVT
jgi:hypothetical protein